MVGGRDGLWLGLALLALLALGHLAGARTPQCQGVIPPRRLQYRLRQGSPLPAALPPGWGAVPELYHRGAWCRAGGGRGGPLSYQVEGRERVLSLLTRLVAGGLEASPDPEDWGVCYTDCPLRSYRNNKVMHLLPTLLR